MNSSTSFFAVAVIRFPPVEELCLAPGSRLEHDQQLPHAVITEMIETYCLQPHFTTCVPRDMNGVKYTFHVMTGQHLGYVLMAGGAVTATKGMEVLMEVSQLFERMFVEDTARLSPSDTLAFVKPAHDLLLRLASSSPSSSGGAAFGARDGLSKVKQEIEEVRVLAMDNVNRAVQRGAKIDDIMVATDDLQFQAQGFHQNSRDVYNHLWWSSMRGKLMVGGVAGFLILLILFTFFY